MPNAGDKIGLLIANNAVNIVIYYGIFAGYDTVTENYIIEDCHNTQSQHKSKMFFNRRYVVMIEHI
jgi:hypothetical protein